VFNIDVNKLIDLGFVFLFTKTM